MHLRLTSFDAVPEHMKRLASIAAEKGLSTSAYLRFMIAQTVRRQAGKRKE
jgi:hypothetical protein